MMELLYELGDLLGFSLESKDLEIRHMALRAIYMYGLLLAVIRFGHKRLLDSTTAFDIVLGILLGSIASRGITGNAPFYPTIAACAVLIAMHAVFAWLTFHSTVVSKLVKGRAVVLLRDGEPDREAMRRTRVADHDLLEALRNNGTPSLERVAVAHLERNGGISVCERSPEPRVVHVAVADGVQTVRIEWTHSS